MAGALEMSIGEFQRLGFLQEVNRKVLHPLGLSLSIYEASDGNLYFSPTVIDARDDAEGYLFDELTEKDKVRADAVEALRQSKLHARQVLFGTEDGVQPF